MQPHVKRLRQEFQIKVKMGEIIASDCCAKCSRSAHEVFQLELHHIIAIKDVPPDSTFNPNTQENIITLCTDCHKAYHVSYEHIPITEYLSNVTLQEAYLKLKHYRDARDAHRREQAKKHRARRG
jgi:cytochrome c553